jgi:hypothetical protein
MRKYAPNFLMNKYDFTKKLLARFVKKAFSLAIMDYFRICNKSNLKCIFGPFTSDIYQLEINVCSCSPNGTTEQK